MINTTKVSSPVKKFFVVKRGAAKLLPEVVNARFHTHKLRAARVGPRKLSSSVLITTQITSHHTILILAL
jgi:hypothetical protein